MNQQSTFTIGGWAFLLGALVSIAFLLVGMDLSKSTWLNRDIAAAQAKQISSQTMIEQRNAELDYERTKFYTELEMQKAQQLATQELQFQAARDAEALAFVKNAHAAAVYGAKIIAILLGLGMLAAGVLGGISLNRYLNALARTQQSLANGRKSAKAMEELVRHIHIQQKEIHSLRTQITALEQSQNHRSLSTDLQDTTAMWPEDPKDIQPRAPTSWVG